MIDFCYLIYPYYENPTMLKMQVENWNRYAGDLRSITRLILVDDCSKKYRPDDIFSECKLPKELYRIKTDIAWNQHGARNLGAAMAGKKGVDNPWMFMSDIDILFTPEMANTLFRKPLDPGRHYTFDRAFLPELVKRKPHCNTFLVKRNIYWAVNGYDEDYCGSYGGDGPFMRQIGALAPNVFLPDITLWGVPETYIEDANTRDLPRDGEMKERYRQTFKRKRSSGDERSNNPLRFEWEKVF